MGNGFVFEAHRFFETATLRDPPTFFKRATLLLADAIDGGDHDVIDFFADECGQLDVLRQLDKNAVQRFDPVYVR